jgi:hypothetical protein
MIPPDRAEAASRSGAVAALLNALISASMFVVATFWTGTEAMGDPERLVEAARARPAAFVAQDALKVASVAVSLVLIAGLARHLRLGRGGLGIGVVGAGVLSEAFLLANAGLSLAALGGVGAARAPPSIGVAALSALVLGGVWLLLVNTVGLTRRRLPPVLCAIGLLTGIASLGVLVLPPMGLASLVLGIAWSVWLGVVLWRSR